MCFVTSIETPREKSSLILGIQGGDIVCASDSATAHANPVYLYLNKCDLVGTCNIEDYIRFSDSIREKIYLVYS